MHNTHPVHAAYLVHTALFLYIITHKRIFRFGY